MKISAVVLVHNLEHYVEQAIQSVLDQSRPADEIIVIDDCSTDLSADLIRGFGDRVQYLRMPHNSGALLAALHGVKATTGDIICMLDGDDYWAANKLEVVEREFSAHADLVLLSHQHKRVDAHGNPLNIRDDTHSNIDRLERMTSDRLGKSALLRDSILAQKGYWLGSAYAFRRSRFDIARFQNQIHAFTPEELKKAYLDLTAGPYIALTNPHGAIGYTSDTEFYYRVHGAASMAGNQTPEHASATALKGKAINKIIFHLLKENHAPQHYLERRKLLMLEYDYLDSLYSERFGQAWNLYVKLLKQLWTWPARIKETKRFFAARLLGSRRFLTLKTDRYS